MKMGAAWWGRPRARAPAPHRSTERGLPESRRYPNDESGGGLVGQAILAGNPGCRLLPGVEGGAGNRGLVRLCGYSPACGRAAHGKPRVYVPQLTAGFDLNLYLPLFQFPPLFHGAVCYKLAAIEPAVRARKRQCILAKESK